MNKLLTPFKWCMLQNFPFIESTFDAIDNYQLLCKIVEYLNKNITLTNQLGVKVEELNKWINSLDLQDEVNKKLDEMAESGELTEIIAQYLNLAGVLAYNTNQDLKNAQNVVNGSIAKTLGTNTYNDGYGNFYKIREITNLDIIDDDNILRLNNFSNLIAEKIKNNYINEKVSKITMGFAEDDDYYIPLGTPIYVDNELGNDNNDGLTIEKPFKTIKGLMDKYTKEGNMNPNIYLKAGQTHNFPFYNILAMTIHFNAYGDTGVDTIINMSNTYHAFYNSHVKFAGTAQRPLKVIGTNFYFDGGSVGAKYTTIEQRLTLNGCNSNFTNCTLKDYLINYSNVLFYQCTVGNTQSWSANITYRECLFSPKVSTAGSIQDTINCSITIMGVTNLDMTNAHNSVNLFSIAGGRLALNANLNVQNPNGTLYSKAIDLSAGILLTTQPRVDNLVNIGSIKVDKRNGSLISDGLTI